MSWVLSTIVVRIRDLKKILECLKIVQKFDGPDMGRFGPWHSWRNSATYGLAHLHRPAIKTGWGRPRTLGCLWSLPSHLLLVSHSTGEPCLPFSSIQFIRSFGKSNRVDRVWCSNLSLSVLLLLLGVAGFFLFLVDCRRCRIRRSTTLSPRPTPAPPRPTRSRPAPSERTDILSLRTAPARLYTSESCYWDKTFQDLHLTVL